MLGATIKGMLAHRLRLFLTATSIALGVAFLTGTLMLNASMQRSFDDLFASVNSGMDTVVRSEMSNDAATADERPSLPAEILERVREVDGVAAAEGRVEGYALLTDSHGKPIQPNAPTLGTNLSADPDLRGDVTLRSGREPRTAHEVAVDATSAREGGLTLGSQVKILFQGPARTFTLVGTVGYGDEDDLGGSTTAFFELATAQRLVGESGTFDTVIAKAAKGTSDAELAARVDAMLPAGYEALTGQAVADEGAADAKESLGFLTIALTVFAGISLFVGSFIIWNTFTMQVAQRSHELAMIRAIGATRRQVMRAILGEAVLLGVAASAIGVLLGAGMAEALSRLMGAFGFALPAAPTRIQASTVAIGLLVGTVMTLVAAAAPARRATRVLPVEALRQAVPVARGCSRVRLGVGALLVVTGLAALLLALFGPAPVMFLPVGVVGAVLGVTTLAPLFMRALAAVIGWPIRGRGLPGELARQNAMRNPSRTSSTAMALVIGLTMVSAVSVFAASMKVSFTDVLTNSTNADLYVLTPTSQSKGYSPVVTEIVRGVDGVETVSPTSFGRAQFDGTPTGFTSVDPATVNAALDLGMVEGDAGALTDAGVLVHEEVARARGWDVGDTVPATFSGNREEPLEIQGVFDGRGFVNTDYVISGAAHSRFVPGRLEGTAVVLVEEGQDVAAVEDRIAEAIADQPDATVMDQAEFQGAMSELIDQLLGLVTVLLLLAVLIALLGIVNTLALSVFERTRELGLLRAVGMTRGQVRSMVQWESVIISVIGALLGAGLGIGLGVALTRALADQGIDQIAIPGVQLGLYVVAAAVAGVLAAVGPGRRASNVDVLRAVVTE